MKYVVHFNMVKRGFFSDTTYQGTEVVEAKDLASAYEDRHSHTIALNTINAPDVLITVTKIEPLTTITNNTKEND